MCFFGKGGSNVLALRQISVSSGLWTQCDNGLSLYSSLYSNQYFAILFFMHNVADEPRGWGYAWVRSRIAPPQSAPLPWLGGARSGPPGQGNGEAYATLSWSRAPRAVSLTVLLDGKFFHDRGLYIRKVFLFNFYKTHLLHKWNR